MLSRKVLEEVGERIEWAKNYRAQFEPEWQQALEFFGGDQANTKDMTIQVPLVVNMFWPQVQTALANLFYRAPYVFVKPSHQMRVEEDGQEDIESNARSGEAVVNRIWRNRRMKRGMKENIVDSLIYSVGWQISGYGSEYGIRPEERVIDSEVLAQARELLGDEGLTEDDVLNMVRYGSDAGNITEFDDDVSRGYAWSRRGHPMNIWIDPDCTDEGDARFMIIKYWRQIRSVKQDAIPRGYYRVREILPQPKYGVTTTEPLNEAESMMPEDTSSDKDQSPSISSTIQADPVDGVWIYDYWDKERQDVYSLVQQDYKEVPGGWMDVKQFNGWPYPDVRGFPVKSLRLNIVPNRFYPFTGVQMWAPLQKEKNLYRSIMAEHARRMGKKVVAKAGFFQDVTEEKKVERSSVGDLIKCSDSADPQRDIAPLDFGAIPPDLYRMGSVIDQDIGLITGFAGSPNAQGQPNPRETTATEVNRMSSVITNLNDDQLTTVSEFAAEVSRDHFLILRQFWSTTEMVQVTNPTDAEKWVKVGPDNLRGEFDFIIEVGSTQRQSHELRQKRANELMQIALNPLFMQAFGPQVLQRIFEWVLRAYQFEYPEEIFKDAKEWMPPGEAMGQQGGTPEGAMQPNQFGGGQAGVNVGPANFAQMAQGMKS